jgi:type IV secretion system protein VirB1
MLLSLAIATGVVEKCVPRVARETALSVLYNESRFDTLAIGDNTTGQSYHPRSRVEAVAQAQALISAGHNIDMGIGQINSRTAARLGLTVFNAFDACRNMAAAGAVMEANYRKARASSSSPQQALAAMLSMYNTGNAWRGFGNGYVGRVYNVAASIVPQLGRTPRYDIDPATIDPVALQKVAARPPQQTLIRSIPTVAGAKRAQPPADRNDNPAPAAAPAPAWAGFRNPANVMVFGAGSSSPNVFNRKEKLP